MKKLFKKTCCLSTYQMLGFRALLFVAAMICFLSVQANCTQADVTADLLDLIDVPAKAVEGNADDNKDLQTDFVLVEKQIPTTVNKNFAALIDDTNAFITLAAPQTSFNLIKKDIDKDNIALIPDKDTNTKKDLANVIEQIRSIEFNKTTAVATDTKKTDPNNKTEKKPATSGNEQSSALDDIADSNIITQKIDQPTPLSKKTLEMVAQICNDPVSFSNPFELAELLYATGRLPEAAILYKQALEKMRLQKGASDYNIAWTMFQTANCLRAVDQTQAAQMYKRLVEEFPDCQWVEVAKAKEKLLQFYMRQDTQSIIKSKKATAKGELK